MGAQPTNSDKSKSDKPSSSVTKAAEEKKKNRASIGESGETTAGTMDSKSDGKSNTKK